MLVTHVEQDLRLRVRAMVWEADDVVSLHLRRLDGSDLPQWGPGAHLDLKLPGVVTRQYSLSGNPHDRATWRITVLHDRAGAGSSRLVHETLRPGDIVDVRGPRNNFSLVDSPEYQFIAGGIGITPLVPMIEQVVASNARWRLVYGGRTRASMAFLSELSEYGPAVEIYPEDEYGLLDLARLFDSPRAGLLVYCCGPEPLLAAVEKRCQAWPTGSLHVERFKPRANDTAAEVEEIAFDVVCEQSGLTVTVPPGKAILEMVEKAGIYPPNSCREGICGTCETTVLEGVPDHRDSILSSAERDANDTMMICVGRSLSPRLVLDL